KVFGGANDISLHWGDGCTKSELKSQGGTPRFDSWLTWRFATDTYQPGDLLKQDA
ncbi:hypothetical protein P7K49_030194, partial [Saguinus oedipus]